MPTAKELYYNEKTGFRGKSAYVGKAKDTDEFFNNNKATTVFSKISKKSYLNPLVETQPNEVMEMDLMDFSKNPDTEYKYMMICIDEFTKYTYGYPLKAKTVTEVGNALNEILSVNKKRTKGSPIRLLSDAEPALLNGYCKDVVEHFGTEIEARAGIHAPLAERTILTLKNRLARYSIATNLKNWVRPIAGFISGMNEQVNSTGYKPKDAYKEDAENNILWDNAFRDAGILKHIDIEKVGVGDHIRIKVKGELRKKSAGAYSESSYKVVKKSGNTLYLEDGKKINSGNAIVVPSGEESAGLRRSERNATSRVEEARVYH